jgi:hypothetical protein
MLLDDRSHLSRLSTLIESNNVTEIDNFSKSPVVTESFDAFHRVALQSPALRTGRVKTPIKGGHATFAVNFSKPGRLARETVHPLGFSDPHTTMTTSALIMMAQSKPAPCLP